MELGGLGCGHWRKGRPGKTECVVWTIRLRRVWRRWRGGGAMAAQRACPEARLNAPSGVGPGAREPPDTCQESTSERPERDLRIVGAVVLLLVSVCE